MGTLRSVEGAKIFFFLLINVSVSFLHAQSTRKPLRIITTKDGLPQSFVSGMVQDKAGFVWIGTRNGLARYDGRHFKVFQHKMGDTSTLQSNIITAVKLDANNRIWIRSGEYRSIDCIDPVTEKIEHITERALVRANPVNFAYRSWLPAANGDLWCLPFGEGAVLYDWKYNRLRRFNTKTGHLPNDTVCEILEGRNKMIWMLTRRGLANYNPATDRLQHFPYPDMVTYPQAFIECRNGELMFAVQDRFILFNPATATFRTVACKEVNGQFSFVQGPDGYYFSTGHLIYRFDGEHSVVPLVNMSDYAMPGLLSLLVDSSGLLWLGANTAGIWQIDPHAPAFSVHPPALSFHYDLLKQEFGAAMDSFDSLFRCGPPHGVLSSYDLRSAYDARQRLFITVGNNVGFFDQQQQKWSALPPTPRPHQKSGIEYNQGICFDPEGRLWAFNFNRFFGYFDTSSRQWVAVVDDTLKALEKTLMLDISVDRDKLWISGGTGLMRIDRVTKKIDHFTKNANPDILPTDDLLGMQPDPSRPDLLWIGSFEGLICLHKSTMKTEVFTTAQGMPDNTIYSIQTDSQGYLWLSTNQGLCRFHPVTHETRNFTAEDGLPGNEFNRFHHLKLPDGRLAFGGVDGWVSFDPNTIVPDTYQPRVALTGLKIYNEPVDYSPNSKLLPQPLNDIKVLVLPYDQNTLTFDFAGLEYNQPAKLHYRYRLEAYDDKWIETDNPVASYTRLAPGRYTLLVNCTNSIGKWSRYVCRLSMRVLPPWWRTWWAYLCYAVVVAGALYALYRNWLKQAEARQLIRFQQKEAEQLKAVDEMKSRFFSNITHEFRTPLSLIIAPLEQLEQNELLPAVLKTSVGKIQGSAHILLRLINQLLDMSKLEARSMKLVLFRGNPQRFVLDVVESFDTAAIAKNIILRFDADRPVATEYLFDADKLHTILSNLLSNAIKFTPRNGQIGVTLAHEIESAAATVFSFRVHDSGIGIGADKLPFIFKRFYQVDDSSTRNYGGTGIGLALAEELTGLMEGSLYAESEFGQGSVFTLRLSLVKAVGTDVTAYTPFVKAAAPKPTAVTANGSDTVPDKDNRAVVLIAEDHPELNQFLVQTFSPLYRVLTAIDGTEAWQLTQQELPDVVISDWMMPGIDGHAFCQAVKSNLLTNHIAFVMLTAKAASASRLQALQGQADDYIAKPFNVEELKLRMANLLERQRRLREKLCRELCKPEATAGQINDNQHTAEDSFISKIHSVIEEHLDEAAFGVEELADGMYMSRVHLHRKVKAVADITPTLLIRNYRLKRTAQFLKEGANSSEAAYKAGFESAAYFSKCFREFYHTTPTEFARQL